FIHPPPPPPRSTLFPYTTLFRSHLPKIIFAAEAQNPFPRCTYLLPEFFCVFIRADFVISFENSEPHACRVEPVFIHQQVPGEFEDRKSTRLNSSHRTISYAVFCL